MSTLGATVALSVDDTVSEYFGPISDFIVSVVFYSVTIFGAEISLIVVWLICAALFFTFWFGFPQLRGLPHAINLVRGRYSDPEDAGEVSHFQALATAVSGTVGLGNIAGVAVAISLGGPGATLWMILAGFLGMASKMAECTLGVMYRQEHADGSVSGGPMYYLRDGVAKVTGNARLGKFLAAFFAVCCIGGSLGGGNMFQANQATAQIVGVTGGDDSPFADINWVIGLVFAAAVGAVIIGGIKSIARVTEKIVPFMAGTYVAACLIVIVGSIDQVPGAFGDIIAGAFNPQSVAGGFLGVLMVGFQRAAFSNEAGIGSASIAHSAVKTKEPATEGFVALLEPLIDTIVVCTMTALTIVITGAWSDPDASELGGVELTSRAFESVIPWFPNVLAVAVVLFAFSTMISWSYYGMKATGYLFGDSTTAEVVFKVVFCLFIVVGAALSLDPVIGFSDSMIFSMSIANVIGLYILARTVRNEVRSHRSKVESGEFARVK
ncbi:alanine glycine permease [Aeromicrobium sp. A1-2]|uniref:alanine/glycine:cation symporter family protein n=1 Tax=Aeromicrobium sp. A1-2 TaxID=2107713 RepID=UPI000E492B90|nr:alanine/glycine:cation symporter family protein [Aeromicrobium sp. A1-2]AXT84315.1 alanine glycine permease [Aeromicrobium sp. A1-2]